MDDHSTSSSVIDPEDQPIVGTKNIADALNMRKRQVEHLIKTKRLSVGRMGKHVFSTPRALKANFKVEG
jgi:hypothetical protein